MTGSPEASVENVNIGADYSGGMFGWYFGDGTIEDSTVKNIKFTDKMKLRKDVDCGLAPISIIYLFSTFNAYCSKPCKLCISRRSKRGKNSEGIGKWQ